MTATPDPRALEIDHHHLFYRQVVAMVTGTSVALLMGASPEMPRQSCRNQSPRLLQWRLAADWRYSGNQRSLRDFRRHPRRVFGHTLLNAMRIRTKAARGLQWGLPRTPSVRRAAPSWIIRRCI